MTATLAERVTTNGFVFVMHETMRVLLGAPDTHSDWQRFVASWNELQLDTYLPDGHRYRRRAHATLSAQAGDDAVVLEPHQPHYQSLDYNPLVGGIERWFEPIEEHIVRGPTLQSVLSFCCRLFGALRPATNWKIECHQFRIEARSDAPGQPTPEGMHRDGVDYVLVLLINRTNIKSGTTTVHDLDGKLLGSFTLTAPLDAALVDDARVKHGVTAVEPVDSGRPAYRDVLVVTFKQR
ncbi:MAG: 2OG-Fe dioxygenase family protein [Burkholderiaceae bacterium]